MRQSCVPKKSNQNLLSRLQLMLHSHDAIWDIAPSPSSKRIFKSRAATKACLAPAGRRFRQSLSLEWFRGKSIGKHEFVFLMIKVSWCFFFKPMSPSFLYPTNKYDIAGIATMARVTATRQATQGQGRLLFAHGNYLRSNLRSQTPGDHLNCRENLQISIGKWPIHGKSPKFSWRFQTLGKSSISMGHGLTMANCEITRGYIQRGYPWILPGLTIF
jgi:hypothetical protein